MKAWPVGGIVYFAQNLIDPNQATEMLANVKHFYSEDGNVAPFLAVDEEGGTVVRIADNDAFGVQDVGDAADLGAAGDATAAKAAASGDPASVQTGPAVRGDRATQERHCELLADDPELTTIYKLISEQIWRISKK